MVTQPESSSAATSELPATSSSDLNPWVTLPTLQLPWSSATVPNVRSAAFIQKTQPAGTRPVRPSGSGAGHRLVEHRDAGEGRVGEGDRQRGGVEVQDVGERRRRGPASRGGHGRQLTDGVRAAIRRRSGTRRGTRRRRRRSTTTRRWPATSGRRRRPWRRAPATARATRSSTTSPSAPRRPRWSSASRIGSASTPSMPRQTRWGRHVGRVAEALDAGHARDRSARRVAPRACARDASSSPVERRSRRRRSPRWRGRPRCRPRRARSCAPPTRNGGNRSPRRTSSAAAPLGPPNLWPVTEQRSAPEHAEVDGDVAGRRAGVDVHDDVAGPGLARPPRPPVAACPPRGWPAARTPARCRAGWPPATSAGSKRPSRSTPTVVTSVAPRATASSTDECSTAVVTTCAGAARARARPTPRCSPPRCRWR